MSQNKQRSRLLPEWNMPSDPVQGVWWFAHWLLKVLVRFFWLPIACMVVYEIVVNGSVGGVFNGIVSGVVTLLIGMLIWGGLSLLLFVVNLWSGVSQVMSGVQKMQDQQQEFLRNSYRPFTSTREDESNVVEGTIIELDEERQRRRKES